MHGTSPAARTRAKLAELTGTTGAGVLGLGLGVLGADALRGAGPALLVLGGLLHGWGMLDKHRLEAGAGEVPPRWARILYWGCWGALGLALIWLVARAMRH